MTLGAPFRSSRRAFLCLTAFLILPLVASAQVTLTGVTVFAAASDGSTNVGQAYEDGFYNTVGGDQWWNLWLALNPNASSPINGPSDAQASIAIPLLPGRSYKYYAFGSRAPDGLGYIGWNLFFNGESTNPGISIYGPFGSSRFIADTSSTLDLHGNPVVSSGSSFYSSGGAIVVLTDAVWDGHDIPPGNVAQPFVFSPNPDGESSSYGWFKLHVFSAATFTATQPSGSPLSELTVTGSGFQPKETVEFYPGHIGFYLIGSAVADADGSFSAKILEPQSPSGSLELFALGLTSGNLGAVKIVVTAAVAGVPKSVAPGGATEAEGLGFGAGEVVSVYLDSPRELLGTATADALGSFVGRNALTVTIPADASAGLNALVGIGATTGAFGIGELIVK